ncbi:hypothetical protein HHJ44_20035 [Escherichia coli]|nr:hypothetical protein HHJ44_20035 [Escherichia coli]
MDVKQQEFCETDGTQRAEENNSADQSTGEEERAQRQQHNLDIATVGMWVISSGSDIRYNRSSRQKYQQQLSS